MPPAKGAKKKRQEQLAEDVKKLRKSSKINLVCADCPTRSTPYVCLNFNTFICTPCSGIHRKFSHRVKSIAVATFTEPEVDRLREGGNELVNTKYLAKYKKGKDVFALPREGERDKVEQYIRMKYVEKKWYKENATIKKEKKEKKKRKSKRKVHQSDDETAEADADPAPLKTKSSQVKVAPVQQASKRESITQPEEDLLSFGSTATAAPVQTTANNTAASGGDDWAFGGDDTGGWDPFDSGTGSGGQQQSSQNAQPTANAQPKPQLPTQQESDGWGDLWNTPTTNTQPTAQPSQPVQQQQVMQQPMQQPMQQQWGGFQQPMMQPQQQMMQPQQQMMQPQQQMMQPQPPVNAGFLGALSTVSAQKQQEEAQKQAALQAQQQANQAAQANSAAPQQEEFAKPTGDPFADLMSSMSVSQPAQPVNKVAPVQQTRSSPQFAGMHGAPSYNAGPQQPQQPQQPHQQMGGYYGAPQQQQQQQRPAYVQPMAQPMANPMPPTSYGAPQNHYAQPQYGYPPQQQQRQPQPQANMWMPPQQGYGQPAMGGAGMGRGVGGSGVADNPF